MSVSSSGAQANGRSQIDAISPDGRFVLFDSWATNLVPGDTNGVRDVFLRDRKRGRTFRVSVGRGGRQANGASRGVAVSSDGRFVLFVSDATNLVDQADRNHNADVFVRNRLRGETFRVSVRPRGGQFRDSRWGGLTAGGISDNGRWVAFGEYVPITPGCCRDIRTYLRDRSTHTTRSVGAGSGWFTLPLALSPDGRWLTMSYEDESFNVVNYAIRDLVAHRTMTLTPATVLSTGGAVTTDAHYLVYGDLNANADGENVLRWNRVTGHKVRLVVNRPFGNIPVGVSDDGRYVAYTSDDPTIVHGDTNGRVDAFRKDIVTKTVVRLDLNSTGGQIIRGLATPRRGVNGSTPTTVLSADGRWAAFATTGGRTVPGDTNRVADVFLRGPLT